MLLESVCSNCGSKAKYGCSKCGKPFCGRCLTREKKDLINNIIVPEGLCKNCVQIRLQENVEGTFNHLSEAIAIYVSDSIENKKIIDNN